MSDHAFILVGMGPDDLHAQNELEEAAHEVGASVAFLQLGTPTLRAELSRLADERAEQVSVVGVMTIGHKPGLSWLRRVVAHWWRDRQGHRPTVTVAGQLASRFHVAGAESGV